MDNLISSLASMPIHVPLLIMFGLILTGLCWADRHFTKKREKKKLPNFENMVQAADKTLS